VGWTGTHRDKGTTDRAFMEAELPDTLTRRGEILDCATVGGTFYAAVRDRDSGDVWALVTLIVRTRDYFNCSYKEMSENMGPNEARCPARILDLLSPTGHEYATEWRQACRDNAAKAARARLVKPGTRIRFGRALEFGNGLALSELTLVKRSTFTDGTLRYSVPNWRTRYDWEVAS
jgi:hypothetical protein